MFARTKKSGKYEYLPIVENRREGTNVNQRVTATLGRLDQIQAKGEVETLVRSLARSSEQALLILSAEAILVPKPLARPSFRAAVERVVDFQDPPRASF